MHMDAGLTDCANGNSRATVWRGNFPSLFQAICATATVSFYVTFIISSHVHYYCIDMQFEI